MHYRNIAYRWAESLISQISGLGLVRVRVTQEKGVRVTKGNSNSIYYSVIFHHRESSRHFRVAMDKYIQLDDEH